MSTRIYNAWRTNGVSNIFTFAAEIRKEARARMREYIGDWYEQLMPGIDPCSEGYQKVQKESPSYSDEIIRLYLVESIVRKGYKEQLGSYEKNPFNFDASINVWEVDARYYLITYGEYPAQDKVFGFFSEHPKLQNFEYQNQGDPDPEVPETEWLERERIWTEIMDNRFDQRLTIDVCNWENFYMIEPSLDMMRAIYEKEKTVTTEENGVNCSL